MKRFIKEYRIEITIVFLILFGIFFLVEQMELRSLFANGFQVFQTFLKQFLSLVKTGLEFYIRSLSLSDLIGWFLLILAIVLALWMVRNRFINSASLRATSCPKCGSSLHRIHRNSIDRLLSRTVLPHARRYLCANPECLWTGLRHPRHRHHNPLVSEQISSNPR